MANNDSSRDLGSEDTEWSEEGTTQGSSDLNFIVRDNSYAGGHSEPPVNPGALPTGREPLAEGLTASGRAEGVTYYYYC